MNYEEEINALKAEIQELKELDAARVEDINYAHELIAKFQEACDEIESIKEFTGMQTTYEED